VIEPSFDDVYDGHGNYLAEVDRELPWVSVRRFADLAIGVLAGWTIAYWVYRVTWPESGRGVDQLLAGIGLTLLGFFATIFFGSLLSDITLPLRNRRLLAASFVFVFLTGVAIPMWTRERVVDGSITHYNKADENLGRSLALANAKWLDDVYAAGAHGPLGTEPPMIVVEDNGTSVTVRNIADRTINCVRIFRHLPNGGGGVILRAGRQDCWPLAPGDSATFSAKEIQPAYEHGPLEFRIGDPKDPEPTWWSDNALATDYPREVLR
jgi:hypothetical protein